MDNGGTPMTVLDDIDGDVRSVVTPDIGADEIAGAATPTPHHSNSDTAADGYPYSIDPRFTDPDAFSDAFTYSDTFTWRCPGQ